MSTPLETPFMVKVSSKGRITFPRHIREALNLNEGDELLLISTKEGLILKHHRKELGGLRGLLKGLNVDVGECEAILSEARGSLVRS